MSIANARIIIDGLYNQNLKRDEFILNSDGTWYNDLYYNLANADDLANVAFSGSYNDLSDKPTIDSSLSFSSTNAVENQAITNTIYDKNSSDDKESGVNIEFSNPTLNPYIHIGSKSSATKGNSSVGIGYNAESSAVRSVAIGPSATATKREGVALGANATAGQYSLSIGYYTNTVPNYSTAVGPYAKVLTGATNATAIGYQSEADEAETISVGKSSNRRRIVNVADGTTATDAATVGQIPTNTSDLTNDSGFLTSVPIASASTLGGIKVGNNLTINSDGTLSANTSSITVDSALSSSSTNPVQNKIISQAIDNLNDDKISYGDVETSDIVTGAVTTVKIADRAVTTAKLAAGIVTMQRTVLFTSSGTAANITVSQALNKFDEVEFWIIDTNGTPNQLIRTIPGDALGIVLDIPHPGGSNTVYWNVARWTWTAGSTTLTQSSNHYQKVLGTSVSTQSANYIKIRKIVGIKFVSN